MDTEKDQASNRRLDMEICIQSSQMLAQAGYPMLYTVLQCTCDIPGLHTFLIHPCSSLTHTHRASRLVVKDVSYQINKPLFESCNSIEVIFIISTQGFVARLFLLFASGLQCITLSCVHSLALYAQQVFVCMSVVIRYASLCFTALAVAKSKAQNFLSICKRRGFTTHVCCLQEAKIWTHSQFNFVYIYQL